MNTQQPHSLIDQACAQSIVESGDYTPDECVARGAAYLDATVPGWTRYIIPETFEISKADSCVWGQIRGSYWEWEADTCPTDQQAAVMGYNEPVGDWDREQPFGFDALQAAWMDEFRRRGLRVPREYHG